MATELASGFINLTVKYSGGMKQVDQDLRGLQQTATREGTRAGEALSQSMGRAAKFDGSDAKKVFNPLEAAAKRSGNDAGENLGEGIISGAKDAVNKGGSKITDGLGAGAKGAGAEAGSGFLEGMAPELAELGAAGGPIGIALAAAGALALAAGGVLANELFKGFERDMANRKLQVQLGIDQSQMANVNEAINNAYKNNFGNDIDTLREDAAAIIKNGLASASDTQGLQNTLQQFDTAAQVTGTGVDELARSVGVLVKSGVAKDTTDALNQIVVAAQNGLDVSGDLMDTLTEYSVQFKKIGIDGTEALGLIKQLMDGGARSTDLAADALKEFAIRSIDGSKTTRDAYQQIGLNADEMAAKLAAGGPAAQQAFSQIITAINSIEDPVKRNTVGVEFFGTQWEDLGGAIRNLDPANAVKALGQVDGAVQRASDTLGGGATSGFESFGRQLEILRGKFDDFLAKTFGPVAKAFGDWIAGVLPKVEDAFKNKIIPAIENLMPVFQDLWNGIKEVGGALGGQWLDNLKNIWPDVMKLGQAMKDAFTAALPLIKGVATVFGALLVVLLKVDGIIIQGVVAAFTAMYTAISAIYNTVAPAITTAFSAIGTAAMFLWNNAIQPAWQGIQAAISVAWSVISVIFEAIKTAVSAIGTVFGYVFDTVVKPLWNDFQLVVSAAWSVISPIWDLMKSGFSAVGDIFMSVFSGAISPAWEAIKGAISSGWDFISGIFESMKGGFQGVADFIKGAWNGLSGIIKSALDAVVGAIRGPMHVIGGLLVDVPTNLGPVEIPGAQIAHDLGAKLQAFAVGGKVQGKGGTDNVLAWLTAGEGVVTKDAMANGGATLVSALNNGWVPPVSMVASMVGHVPGFAEGLNPGADFLRNQIMQLWPQITSIGGRRSEDGFGEHSSGNAIDVMIPGWDTPQGKALGDAVASFVAQNSSALGLDGFIWRQTSFGYGGSFTNGKPMSDRGSPTQNHMDHVHVILGKGRGAGAPAVNAPTSTLSLPSGSSFSPGSGNASGGSGGATPQQLQSAQDKIADTQARLDTSQMALDEATAKGTTGSALKAKQDAVDKNKRELDQAKQDLATLKTKTGDAKGGTGSNSNNPFSQIISGIGQLADLGVGGIKESFLPPGFSDPTQWGGVQAGSAVLKWVGGLIGGLPEDRFPGAKAAGTILGGAGSAITGDASGALNAFGSLIPQGQNGPVPGQPGGPMTPDPNGGNGNGPVNVDNSVHIAEGGQVGTDPVRVMEAGNRQQVAAQTPQLGTRRFV